MDSGTEILMSTRELGCRRTNQQSQRYLSCVLKQLDLEKHLVQRDWDNRMKTLLSQKKRVMPDGWDPRKPRRPNTAWNHMDKHKFYVISRPESGVTPGPVAPKIPEHWNLCASYKLLPSGERIPQQLPDNNTPQRPAKLGSARPGTARRRCIRPRRAVSAPVRRSGLSTCLVTLQDNNEKLNEIILANDKAKQLKADDLTTKKTQTSQIDNHNKAIVRNRPPSGFLRKNRPVSAVNMRQHSKINNGKPYLGSVSSNSSSSLASSPEKEAVGSYTLLKQIAAMD